MTSGMWRATEGYVRCLKGSEVHDSRFPTSCGRFAEMKS